MEGDYRIVPPDDGSKIKPKSKGVLVWRVINAIMAVFFLLAAYANLNDSDWYLWVPIYTVPGVLSLISFIKPDSPNSAVWSYTAVTFLGFCVGLAVYIIISSADIKGLHNPLQFEEGRELSGVLIMITWIGISKYTNIGRPGTTVNNNMMRNSLLLIVCVLAIIPIVMWSLCLHQTGSGYFHHCKGMFQDTHVQAKQEF